MDFCSLFFPPFFLAAVAVYWAVPRRMRRYFLLGASLLFAAGWGLYALAALMVMSLATWLAAKGIEKAAAPARRRAWLWFGVLCSAGAVFGIKLTQLVVPHIALSTGVGMAFYGLQAASFLMQLAKEQAPRCPPLPDHLLYMSFFPRLVCGPIQRAEDFHPQLAAMETAVFDRREAEHGMTVMLGGYAYKAILALPLTRIADTVFAGPDGFGPKAVFCAVMAFGFSLYFDFCGYSRIALGAAQVLGVRLPENFRAPYLALGPAEFWQRWHITLTAWLRDYIYIPLGGNRRGRLRKYGNLMVTWLASGLWHGCGWNYILWGAVNALYQIAEDLLRPLTRRYTPGPLGRAGCRCGMMLLFNFSFLFFRARDIGTAVRMIGIMLHGNPQETALLGVRDMGLAPYACAALCAALAAAFALELAAQALENRGGSLYLAFSRLPCAVRWVLLLALAALTALYLVRLTGGDSGAFYYAAY